MTIQDWGALGEIIGGLAVVASLVYLAIQIRQNTQQVSRSLESSRLEAFERNVEGGNRLRELMILNPDVAELATRGAVSFSELSGTDKFRYELLMSNIFSGMQGAYIRGLSIDSDPSNLVGPIKTLDSLVKQPGVREWLDSADPDWRPEFHELVQKRLDATRR